MEEPIIPFKLFNQHGAMICKEGELVSSYKLSRLSRFKLFCFEVDYKKFMRAKKQEEEISKVRGGVSDALRKLSLGFTKNLLESIRCGKTVTREECCHIRDKLIDEIKETSHEISTLDELCIIGDYENAHPINVANLSIALALKLHLETKRIQDLALAAMLHDVGKSKLPLCTVKKNYEELEGKEKKLYELHPLLGNKIVTEDIGFPKHIGEAILHHHETYNGTGYPNGLTEERINYYSYIISIASTYDEMLHKNKEDGEIDPRKAIKKLLTQGSQRFHPRILYSFVNIFDYNSSELVLDQSAIN